MVLAVLSRVRKYKFSIKIISVVGGMACSIRMHSICLDTTYITTYGLSQLRFIGGGGHKGLVLFVCHVL